MAPPIPPFSDLPLDKNGPHHNAWGLYGKNDQLGTLNRLTPDVVQEASKEIQTGTRINLDWPLDAQGDIPFFGRQEFHKNVYQKAPRIVNDDVWTFNTQSSSQWDGLRHFAYQKEARFYNNVTLEQIHGRDGKAAESTVAALTSSSGNNVLGVGAMAEQGGIVGRGILIDYHRWRLTQQQKQNLPPHNPFKTSSIPLADLKAALAAQGTEVKFGDILLIRSGYIRAYADSSREELEVLRQRHPPAFAGIEQSEEMMEFLWTSFSAAGGDHPSLEAWPTQKDYALHEVLLAGWGMPIGELFDLEALAAQCEKSGRWSFFVVSKPNYVPGGVASPPNAVAIF